MITAAILAAAAIGQLDCQLERQFTIVHPAVKMSEATAPAKEPAAANGAAVDGTMRTHLGPAKPVDDRWAMGNDVVPENETIFWQFSLQRGADNVVRVFTKQDIAQLSGEWQSVDIAPGQYVFATVAGKDGCTFTEQLCAAMVEVSDDGDGQAAVSVMIPASSKIEGTERREHFQLIAVGTCLRAEEVK